MSKVMFSLPDKLVIRLRANIPARERSKVLCRLLEKEIESREKGLYQRAMELEACAKLSQEMEIWDDEFGEDGLEHV